jgi:hypothetical protein
MSTLNVYLAVKPCDMRKGFDGLTTAAVEHLPPSKYARRIFAHTNQRQFCRNFSSK